MASFMAARIVHRLAAKRHAIFRRTLTTRRQRTTITLANVEIVIDMPAETAGAAVPRSGTYEHAAREPFRSIISIGGTVVWRRFVVSVRAHGRNSDAHGNARGTAAGCEKTGGKNKCFREIRHVWLKLHFRCRGAGMFVNSFTFVLAQFLPRGGPVTGRPQSKSKRPRSPDRGACPGNRYIAPASLRGHLLPQGSHRPIPRRRRAAQ